MEAAARGLAGVAARVAVGAAGVGVAVAALAVALQERLVYVPAPPGVPREYPCDPSYLRLPFRDLALQAADGVRLHAWLVLPPCRAGAPGAPGAAPPGPCLLWLQENAGNMAHRLPFVRMLTRRLGVAVLMLSYRGYGASEGSPTQRGLELDAEAALAWLSEGGGGDGDPARLLVMGRSLGGAVALGLAAAHPGAFRGVIVENTFTCVADMAGLMLPFLRPFLGRGSPLRNAIRSPWDNAALLSRPAGSTGALGGPLLMMASGRDEMVGRQMFELRAVATKAGLDPVWEEFPEAHHMDAYEVARAQYWPALEAFCARAFAQGATSL